MSFNPSRKVLGRFLQVLERLLETTGIKFLWNATLYQVHNIPKLEVLYPPPVALEEPKVGQMVFIVAVEQFNQLCSFLSFSATVWNHKLIFCNNVLTYCMVQRCKVAQNKRSIEI